MSKLPVYVIEAIIDYGTAYEQIVGPEYIRLTAARLEGAIERYVNESVERRFPKLYAHEPYDPKSQVCCVKGCSDGAVWGCPPLCEHHTELLEPKLIEEQPDYGEKLPIG